MSEWWTYRPSDFLMFAPRTYWRLFELHNQAWWPMQPLVLLLGAAWFVWLIRRGAPALRIGALGFAAAWAFVAAAFLLQRYAPINWAASYFAALYVANAIGLGVLAAVSDLRIATRPHQRHAGLALMAWALLAHPLLAPAFGRPWAQAEIAGLAPDPTAIATLGLLLCADAPGRAARWLIGALRGLALAWCAISAATLATMGSPQFAVPLAAGLVTLVVLWRGRRARSSPPG